MSIRLRVRRVRRVGFTRVPHGTIALYPLFVYPCLPGWSRKLFLVDAFRVCSAVDARQSPPSRFRRDVPASRDAGETLHL